MSHTVSETTIGAIVVAVAVGFLLYASNTVGFNREAQGLHLVAGFNSANGVSVGTDVRMAGIKIGTVQGMRLDADSYRAYLDLALVERFPIPDDSAVSISQDGLLGGSYVEVIPGGSDENMASGDEFLETQSSVSFLSLLLRFVSGAEE